MLLPFLHVFVCMRYRCQKSKIWKVFHKITNANDVRACVFVKDTVRTALLIRQCMPSHMRTEHICINLRLVCVMFQSAWQPTLCTASGCKGTRCFGSRGGWCMGSNNYNVVIQYVCIIYLLRYSNRAYTAYTHYACI